MKENLLKLLRTDVSNLIITPFTWIDALAFHCAFLIGFIDHVMYGGLEKSSYFLRLKATPSKDYLFQPLALICILFLIGYTGYLSKLVLSAQVLREKTKYIIAMTMHILLSIVSLVNGLHWLSIQPQFQNLYDTYVFVLSLYFVIHSSLKLGLLIHGNSEWQGLTKKDVISKFLNYQMGNIQFIFILSSSMLMYLVFRSFNGITVTILQTYLLTAFLAKRINTMKDSPKTVSK